MRMRMSPGGQTGELDMNFSSDKRLLFTPARYWLPGRVCGSAQQDVDRCGPDASHVFRITARCSQTVFRLEKRTALTKPRTDSNSTVPRPDER